MGKEDEANGVSFTTALWSHEGSYSAPLIPLCHVWLKLLKPWAKRDHLSLGCFPWVSCQSNKTRPTWVYLIFFSFRPLTFSVLSLEHSYNFSVFTFLTDCLNTDLNRHSVDYICSYNPVCEGSLVKQNPKQYVFTSQLSF